VARLTQAGYRTREDPAAPAARLQRADGGFEIAFAAADGTTRLARLYQSDPCRVLFPAPEPGEPPQAVLLTTAGGLTGGDRIRQSVELADRAVAMVLPQAAEKIYRSTGDAVETETRVRIGAGAVLEWLPQETILFDGARLHRSVALDLEPDATILIGDMVVFGRIARGERFADGAFVDDWRLRRAGVLQWLDRLDLGDAPGLALARPAGFDGAVASGFILLGQEGAAGRIGRWREICDAAMTDGLRLGASALRPDLAVLRLLGRDAQVLRVAFGRLWAAVRAEALGRAGRLPGLWRM